jgi:hypothetical protein
MAAFIENVLTSGTEACRNMNEIMDQTDDQISEVIRGKPKSGRVWKRVRTTRLVWFFNFLLLLLSLVVTRP